MGEKWIRAVTSGWLCTHNESCGAPAVWELERESGGACAEHAEAMGVPEELRKPSTTIHVGWRVVRERDGVREWWGGHNCWSPSPAYATTFTDASRFLANSSAQREGGRVVRVKLRYRRGG